MREVGIKAKKNRIVPIIITIIVVVLTLILLVVLRNPVLTMDSTQIDRWAYGSCGKPEGKIVVLSIYTDNDAIVWSNSPEDELRKDTMRERLLTGTKWISNQAQEYGKSVEFVCDWKTDSDLKIITDIEDDLTFVSDTNKKVILDNIRDEIAERGSMLIKKYDADGIIYAYMLNIPETKEKFSSVAMPYHGNVNDDTGNLTDNTATEESKMDSDIIPCDRNEAVILGYTTWGIECYPAIYAHEILHLFGAPDFYDVDRSGNNYGTNEESVKWFEENNANDIMYEMYSFDDNGIPKPEIVQEITDATAYYIGWIEDWTIRSELGLEENRY